MGREQGRMFDPGEYRAHKLADFKGIPEIIWPTPVYVLEQGGDILFYRNADAARGITKKQDQIFRILARVGTGPDDDHSQTVVVATGAAGVTFDRTIAVYDHMMDDTTLRLAQEGEVEGLIARWWREREGRR